MKTMRKTGYFVALLVLLALVLAACAESSPVAPEATLSPEDEAILAQVYEEVYGTADRAAACGPMVGAIGEADSRSFDYVYDYAMGTMDKRTAGVNLSLEVQDLFDDHGDACGPEVSELVDAMFRVYARLLDNPEDVVAATQKVADFTDAILDAVNVYTGVEVPE